MSTPRVLAPPVVLFTNSPPMGGMEQHVLLLATGLIQRGVRTALVCSPRPEIRALRDELEANGAEVHTPSERASAADGPRRFQELTRVFRQYRGGILHVHSTGFHGGDLVMLAGRRARMAGIVRTEHVPPQPPIDHRHRIQVRLRDRFLLDRAICVSESNRREHQETLGRRPEKLAVVPNGIDVERFATADGAGVHAELCVAAGTPLVGVVARLAEERKGIAQFLQMAALVSRAHPNVHFVVVGDGPLRPALEAQAAELIVDRRVTFLGARHDVPRLMAAMRIFVMPSLYEGGPLTLLEAMALGKAVVTTPVGVAEDVVVDGETGLIVPTGDVDALSAAVRRLLEDPDLASLMGGRAQTEARRSFSIEHMVDRTISVYRSVL